MSAVLKLPVVQMSGVDEGSDLYIRVAGNFAVYGLAQVGGQPAVSVLTTELGTWQILAESSDLTKLIMSAMHSPSYTCMTLKESQSTGEGPADSPSAEAGRE